MELQKYQKKQNKAL